MIKKYTVNAKSSVIFVLYYEEVSKTELLSKTTQITNIIDLKKEGTEFSEKLLLQN